MTFVLWMTGLPCSGKTTIANKLQYYIVNLEILDGDELREWLSPRDFSRQGRIEHNVKVAHIAKLLLKRNIPVCVSLISPYNEIRKAAKKIIGEEYFIEVYVNCPLDVCESRDVKGLYKKAKKNEVTCFTGISDIYEIPDHPDLVIDTENIQPERSVMQILSYLKSICKMPEAIEQNVTVKL